MARLRRAVVIGLLGVVLAAPSVAARSISDSLGNFVSQSLGVVATGVVFPNIAGEFIQRVAIGSLQLPVPANSTSFTFTYNPALGVFERSSGSLGPVFVDRGETVGEGRFDLIFSYQFANLTDLDNESFGEQLEFAFGTVVDGVAAAGAFLGRDFSLKQNVFSFNATYGITDNWDVNLLVPMVYTTLDLDGIAGGAVGDSAIVTRPVSFHDSAFGIGDILLRTKYRFYENRDVVLLAAALTLRMPSGSDEDFQGLGDFTIMPTFIASKPIGRHDIHMNLGMEFNTNDSEATRARYAFGATIQPFDRFAFLIDFLGSSGLDDDVFTVPTGNVTPVCGPLVNCVNYAPNAAGTAIDAVVPQSNIIDMSTGIKFNPFGNANVYLLAIFPLTQQGLRAVVVPAGGVEWTF
jgi:hypothetical protein